MGVGEAAIRGCRLGVDHGEAVWCSCETWLRRGFFARAACEHMRLVNDPLVAALGLGAVAGRVARQVRMAADLMGRRGASEQGAVQLAGELVARCGGFPTRMAVWDAVRGRLRHRGFLAEAAQDNEQEQEHE